MINEEAFKKYICRACGLIYDEELGDPDSGLAPGTRFEDIPEDWECPLCGVTKSDFDLIVTNEVEAPTAPVNIKHEKGVIVIGAGIAGWSAVEAIRAASFELPITLITACEGHRYHKPELSVAIGRKQFSEQLIRETASYAATRLGIQLIPNTYVVGLDPHLKRVRTTRGTFDYTDLIIAQGSRPIIPEPLNHEQVWHVNHLQKWNGFRQTLTNDKKHIAILGAGMVGCELAEDLTQAGHQVTLIDRNSLPLSSLLPELAAERVLTHLQTLGVNFISNATLETVDHLDSQVFVKLSSEIINVDELVVATGLTTENRLARIGNIEFNSGFCVNPKTMMTNQPHVYALGDCSSVNGTPCRFIEPIQRQAQTIAAEIVGLEPLPYNPELPVIRIKTPLLPVVLHGSPDNSIDWKVIEDKDGHLLMQQINQGNISATLEIGKKSRQQAA